MQQLANVHGDDDLALRSVRQEIAGVLSGHARVEQLLVRADGGGDGIVEESLPLGVGGDGVGRDHINAVLELHVALALLVEARDAVTHELMGERAGDAVDGEGVARVLERGKMPTLHDGRKHAANALLRHRFHKLGRAHRRIAQPRRSGDRTLGVGRMVQKLNMHRELPLFLGIVRGSSFSDGGKPQFLRSPSPTIGHCPLT